MNMLAVLLCWKVAVVLVALKERFIGIFCPLECSFGASFVVFRGRGDEGCGLSKKAFPEQQFTCLGLKKWWKK